MAVKISKKDSFPVEKTIEVIKQDGISFGCERDKKYNSKRYKGQKNNEQFLVEVMPDPKGKTQKVQLNLNPYDIGKQYKTLKKHCDKNKKLWLSSVHNVYELDCLRSEQDDTVGSSGRTIRGQAAAQ